MAELTCVEKLAEARSALHALNTGQQVTQVRQGDKSVSYTAAQISDLQAYVSRLEAECGETTSAGARRKPFKLVF